MPFRIKLTLAVLLAFLSVIIIGPLIFPVRPLEDTVDAASLADPNSQFIEAAGVTLHYKTYGEKQVGKPVFLLLHGFGSSLYTWHELAAPLSELGYVIVYDRPAFGLSERPLRGEWQQNPYTSQAQIEQATALLDALGTDQAILVGHSAGGLLATQIALAAPERVRGLVLIAATVYNNGSMPAALRPLLYTPQLSRMGPTFMRQFAGESDTNFLESAWSNSEQIDDATRAAYQKPLQIHDWDKALWELSKASRQPNVAANLTELDLPTLVLSGADDTIVPLELSERLAAELPDADLHTFETCGHIPQEECPATFIKTFTAWLESLEGKE